MESKMKELIDSAIAILRNEGIEKFSCRLLYFTIQRKNLCVENLRYGFASMVNRFSNYVKVTVNDYQMYINPKDKGISKELYLYGGREFFSTEFMKNYISKDDVVIDIGANIGYYALLEGKLARKGEIYCVEPVPANVHLLKKNIELNNCKNISVFQYAIGDFNGKSKIYIYDKCNWSSFIRNPKGNIVEEIEVPVMTLDTFVKKHVHRNPTLIRMDVEGYEYNILKGASETLRKSTKLKLAIEMHPHLMPSASTKELLNILKGNDFKVRAIILDPKPRDYKDVGALNRLRRKLGLPELGVVGRGYQKLDNLLKLNCACHVFFEK